MLRKTGPAASAAFVSCGAAVACGAYENVEAAAAQIVEIVDTIKPEQELVAKYEKQYEKFKQIYPTCKDLFEVLVK